MTRRTRKLAAILGLFALLFLQLATVAYACALQTDAAQAVTAMASESEPCHDSTPDSDGPCLGHCVATSQPNAPQPQPVTVAPVSPSMSIVSFFVEASGDPPPAPDAPVHRCSHPHSRLPVLRL